MVQQAISKKGNNATTLRRTRLASTRALSLLATASNYSGVASVHCWNQDRLLAFVLRILASYLTFIHQRVLPPYLFSWASSSSGHSITNRLSGNARCSDKKHSTHSASSSREKSKTTWILTRQLHADTLLRTCFCVRYTLHKTKCAVMCRWIAALESMNKNRGKFKISIKNQ